MKVRQEDVRCKRCGADKINLVGCCGWFWECPKCGYYWPIYNDRPYREGKRAEKLKASESEEKMPRYHVERPDGQWACFSSIVDDYVTPFMPWDGYVTYQAMHDSRPEIRREEMESFKRGEIYLNRMDYDEAEETSKRTRKREGAE